jgi:hypothetical protein
VAVPFKFAGTTLGPSGPRLGTFGWLGPITSLEKNPVPRVNR